MTRLCDHCDQPATVHETVIKTGVAHEVHLCADHARAHGYVLPTTTGAAISITQILQAAQQSQPRAPERTIRTCPSCGMTIANLQAVGLLGCPDCYRVFEELLSGVIQRAQDGASVHVGRHPAQAATLIDRAALRNRLAKELREAVSSEEYERAARLRDRLSSLGTAGDDDRGAPLDTPTLP